MVNIRMFQRLMGFSFVHVALGVYGFYLLCIYIETTTMHYWFCFWLFLLLFMLNVQHFGQSPLPAYEPAFDWENERSLIFGQRIPETPISQYGSPEMFLIGSLWSVFPVCFSPTEFFFCHPFSVGHLSGMKISVKVQSLQFQAGLSGECYALVIDWDCLDGLVPLVELRLPMPFKF
jgi:hypothetical protein